MPFEVVEKVSEENNKSPAVKEANKNLRENVEKFKVDKKPALDDSICLRTMCKRLCFASNEINSLLRNRIGNHF